MKCPDFLKKPWVQLTIYSVVLFFLPYIAPLIQGGESDAHTWGFWPSRLLFIIAAGAVILLTALWIKKKPIRIGAVTAIWALLELLIMFEAFMLCFVGHSFDQSFLLHFNTDAISGEVMSVFWKPVTIVLLVYAAAGVGTGFLAGRTGQREFKLKELPALLIAVVLFFVPNTPLAVLTGTIIDNIRAGEPPTADIASIKAHPGKNLVFIVVESLEQNYASEEHFPGLIPNITKWMNADNSLVFENMVSASTNTFDFLYQSHMGNYMYSISDSEYADRQVSLPLILKKAGYNTSFLKACTLDFASTGTFVEKVQYDKRMDWQTPEIKAQATHLGEWGFRDYDLFEMAKGEFQKLAAKKQPFCFTLFTVDSHAPNGVLGSKSLTYKLPNGEKYSLLSALHTTDAALGKFLEFIKNSPEGKNTVVVIVGDHLVMKDMVPRGKSVQSMLEYKERKNLLAFIINGQESGKVVEKTWPVDLAPVILHQMGVTHNAIFPSGVNILVEKNAPPRKKLSYDEYMKQQKNRSATKDLPNILNSSVTLTGNKQNLVMNIAPHKVKCDPLDEKVGTFMEFHAKYGSPTQYKNYLDRDFIKMFRTNTYDRNLFYMLCSCKQNLLHFVLGEYNYNKCILASVVSGWYKYHAADKLSQLKLNGLNNPIPRIADAKFDVSKNIVTISKDGWTLPLFSKNNTYFEQSAIAAADDRDGKETVMRMYFHEKNDIKNLYDLLANKDKMTLIAPPDSEFHKKYNVPNDKIDHILRLHKSPEADKLEMISMRIPGEMFISKTSKGVLLLKEDVEDFRIHLTGPAPAMNFANGLCYAVIMDAKTEKIISTRSFKQSSIASELMLNRKKEEKTLLICGKGSEFLKKFYPDLAEKTVLFSITSSHIRHSIQYSNGNFRIPEAKEPLDVLGGARANLADGLLIISWGNASFVMPEADWNSHVASGREIVIKLQQHNPADFVFFSVNDPAWLPDISKAWKTDFLLLGTQKSKFPTILQQPNKTQFFIALSRGFGWELSHSNNINFSVDRAFFKFEK